MPEETFENFVQRLHISQTSFDELAQICFELKQEIKTESIVDWAEVFLGDLRDTEASCPTGSVTK